MLCGLDNSHTYSELFTRNCKVLLNKTAMNPTELKATLIAKAIENQERFIEELRTEVKTMLRGEGSTDEGGFSGTRGDFGAAGQENYLREQAQYNRNEIEKHEMVVQILKAVNTADVCANVCPGALVETNHGTFFFTQALRPIELEGKQFHFLATDAPIFSAMSGMRKGDSFSFRDINYKILSIV